MSDATHEYTFELVEWEDPRAIDLRRSMDVEMGALYADAPLTPEQAVLMNAALTVDPTHLNAIVLAITPDGHPVAHAALRILEGEWEVKRVIVDSSQRGKGLGHALMSELERIARDGGAHRLILQTGNRQLDAVRLYERLGYTPIPVYAPYAEAIPFSLCFEKVLD
jgi:GNAT superfamily N-acetyltransferase